MTQILSKLFSRAGATNNAQKFNKIAIASSSAALIYWSYLLLSRQRRSHRSASASDQDVVLISDKKQNRRRKRKRVDFGKTLKQLRIILGTIMSYQDLALTCGVTLGLILRTLLDLWNIQVSTQVESSIITANLSQLKYTLASFAITMPTLAFINNSIKYFTDKLSLRIRYNLSRQLYEKYMNNMTFYYLTQKKNSNGEEEDQDNFENIDQLLTSDVDKFSSSIVEVYNNLSKPILDIILLVHRMSTGYTGVQTPAIMISWLAFVGSVLTQARRPMSSYIIRETQSEGQLRFVHSRLIQNSEEIAFFKGSEKEKFTLMSALNNLKFALDDLILFKFKIGMMDNIIGRYMSTVVGYLALAMPFFSLKYAKSSNEDRLTLYYVSGRMMMKLAESITRVIMAGQDLTKLAAYTDRVQSLQNSMQSIERKMLELTSSADRCQLIEICDSDNPMIDFKNVTLCTPNGDILVKNLTFSIKLKQSVLITGPNGSGKSSLFRVLGDLWPIESGKIIKPANDQLFYICQKPYMTLGSLRNQIIFPHSKSKLSDSQLIDILNIVELKYLLERDSGKALDGESNQLTLDSVNDWQDLLSGGEKQRMALARLIYHRPQFAILDECTSAVAIDVEQRIYKYLSEELECTLLSVSHRVKQLAKFHHLILEFDGNGSFEFKRLVAQI